MPRRNQIAGRAIPNGQLSAQSLSEYLATLGLFLMLCISGMLTFLAIRLIEARFPGTPQPAYWVLGVGIFVVAYFAYGQIKLAPLLAPVLFVVVLLLCREVASKPVLIHHSRARASYQSR